LIGLGIESTAHTFSCAVIEKKGKKYYLTYEKFTALQKVKEFIHVRHQDITLKIAPQSYLTA
jgi:tRNA A37 threonylcarbamoyltransferase TsaD